MFALRFNVFLLLDSLSVAYSQARHEPCSVADSATPDSLLPSFMAEGKKKEKRRIHSRKVSFWLQPWIQIVYDVIH